MARVTLRDTRSREEFDFPPGPGVMSPWHGLLLRAQRGTPSYLPNREWEIAEEVVRDSDGGLEIVRMFPDAKPEGEVIY